MTVLLGLCALAMLLMSHVTMDAVSAACRLFVQSVMPGLLPYLTVALLLMGRMKQPVSKWALLLMGWGGGSPAGARLLTQARLSHRDARKIAVACATMSPMFLMGTLGLWLNSVAHGACILLAVVLGGALASCFIGGTAEIREVAACKETMTFGNAVESAMKTMLLVCGTMAFLRVAAAFARLMLGEGVAGLVVTTLLEVTTGVRQIMMLSLPMPLKTALMAGATGFGGLAVLMQNRAVWPKGLMSFRTQVGFQLLHGGLSFLIALGLATMMARLL